MIIHGSISHTYSGRKRKATSRVRKVKPVFKPLKATNEPYRRETPEYKSSDTEAFNVYCNDGSFRKEISSKYTVAPAYNKGAYQVISRENVKDIGK